MVNPVLYENYYDGAYLVSAANATISRENGVMNNTTGSPITFQTGLVLSQNANGVPGTTVVVGNTGTVTIDPATPDLANVQQGIYTIKFTAANAFTVYDPKSDDLGNGALAQAFADQIKFSIAAGGTAFVAGDSFTITVPAGAGDYVPYTGALPAAAILYNLTTVPAGASRKIAVTRRQAEVNASEIQWDPSVTGSGNVATLQAQAIAQLQACDILFR